jgi:hypothetical protein
MTWQIKWVRVSIAVGTLGLLALAAGADYVDLLWGYFGW